MKEYYAYVIQYRKDQGTTLLRGGRLFQQYLVGAYTANEERILSWTRNNQDTLRVDMYHNNYQDAMALCHAYGNPDMFITFTSNLKWPEINEMLTYVPGQRAHDRPEVKTRLFKLKLTQLLDDLTKNHIFGETRAFVYVIESQKRGLPHAHILLWLKEHCKCKTLDHIDDIISTELPSTMDDPMGYKGVIDYMLHGPCGKDTRYDACNVEALLEREGINVTLFIDWFDLNERHPPTRTLCDGKLPAKIKDGKDEPSWIEILEKDDAYLRERAILTPRNDDADAINAYMFDKLDGESITYNSADEICKALTDTLDQ
nr:hypothetical protein [Tanacetum cinerariifolium]